MENRVFVYKRLNGKEVFITGGSFGISYKERTIKKSITKEQMALLNIPKHVCKIETEPIKAIPAPSNTKDEEVLEAEKKIKQTADKYINPILSKVFGVKINYKVLAKEFVSLKKRFK